MAELEEEGVGLLSLSPRLLPAFAAAFQQTTKSISLRELAERVLYGDVADRQLIDAVSLEQQLQQATSSSSSYPPYSSCSSSSFSFAPENDATAAGLSIKLPFLRRVSWARLLRLLPGDDLHAWAIAVEEQRLAYRLRLEQQQLSAKKLASLDPQRFHPLAATAGNPWRQKQEDEELQEEIWRDIERTYPERFLFTQQTTRRSLQRVLFAWAKSNPDVGYRQGMNELLAVIFAVCSREALQQPAEDASDQQQQQQVNREEITASCARLFSSAPQDIEADAFRLFDALMNACCMRSMYLPPPQQQQQQQGGGGAFKAAAAAAGDLPLLPSAGSAGALRPPPPAQQQSAVLLRCDRVFNKLLSQADPVVYRHLESLGVEPQLFLLRWLRLLFCREFHLEDSLLIWDAIFADGFLAAAASSAAAAAEGEGGGGASAAELSELASARLPLVDFIAVAMLEFIRQHLLQADFSGCLRRLLKFPPIESVQSLIALALATRKAGRLPPPLAAAAASSSSSSGSSPSFSRQQQTARYVQSPPPPLAPCFVVQKPQLQEDCYMHSSSKQQQQQASVGWPSHKGAAASPSSSNRTCV